MSRPQPEHRGDCLAGIGKGRCSCEVQELRAENARLRAALKLARDAVEALPIGVKVAGPLAVSEFVRRVLPYLDNALRSGSEGGER